MISGAIRLIDLPSQLYLTDQTRPDQTIIVV